MARNVEDCALFMAAIAGPNARVPIALNASGADFLVPLQRIFKGTRIALYHDVNGQLPIASSEYVFQQLGCDVEHQLPDFTAADSAFKTLRAWSMATNHSQRLKKHRALNKDSLIWNIEQGMLLRGSDIAAAEQQRSRFFQRVSDFRQTHELLVLPMSQVRPFDATLEYPADTEGVTMNAYIDWLKSCYYLSTIDPGALGRLRVHP
jgi:amidase